MEPSPRSQTSRLLDDYAGDFDPGFHLGRLSRGALARLGREYMLFGHLLDRALMPQVGRRLGPKRMEEIAIEEWMGASPVYTERMREALRIDGDDATAILKSFQLDVGFPHQYMDVGYEVASEHSAFFWLRSCGALLDVEPFGERGVISMCHAIEDPTFDATVQAVNPKGRCRPVHRPPRVPADRVPHCRWEVLVDPETPTVPPTETARSVRRSRLARVVLARQPDAEHGGRADYAGPFDPGFQLEDLSHAALVLALREFLVACHLVVRSGMTVLTAQEGRAVAEELAAAQWIGASRVASERLRRCLAVAGDDAGAILKVLQLHPAFVPGYVRLGFELVDQRSGRFWIDECDALAEEVPAGWLALPGPQALRGLAAMVQGVNPRARVRPLDPPGSARLAFEVRVDAAAEPAPDPPEAAGVRASTASRVVFEVRRAAR